MKFILTMLLFAFAAALLWGLIIQFIGFAVSVNVIRLVPALLYVPCGTIFGIIIGVALAHVGLKKTNANNSTWQSPWKGPPAGINPLTIDKDKET